MFCCLFVSSSASRVLTRVSGVVDGFVRLDEDVPGVKGHHQHPLLGVEAAEVHLQIHKLVLFLFGIQTIGGKLLDEIGEDEEDVHRLRKATVMWSRSNLVTDRIIPDIINRSCFTLADPYRVLNTSHTKIVDPDESPGSP